MNAPLRVLIADDEPELRAAIRSQIQSPHQVEEAIDGQEALDKFASFQPDLVLLDVRMPRKTGLEVLRSIKELNPSTTVVMITAHASIQDAVSAVQVGAFDYIEKPLQVSRLQEILTQVLQARNLVKQVTFSNPQGSSQPMKKVFELIDRLAKVNTSVLLRGESGTGKELIARAIHFNSPRKNRPFVAVNCSGLSDSQIESELFGHEKGAFQGADSRKIGLLQYASGGTIFLDEIAEIPLSAQTKILRLLEDRKMTPVGAGREVAVDIRIIAATHRDLESLVKKEAFREDLFYKLNVTPITLPPLRERTEDLAALVSHFVASFNAKHNKNLETLESSAFDKLKLYAWPGNIRELETAIEHAFVVSKDSKIKLESLPEHILEAIKDREEGWNLAPSIDARIKTGANFPLDYQKAKEDFEKQFITNALRKNNGKINQTCENANIPKNTLLRKIRKYQIQAKDPG